MASAETPIPAALLACVLLAAPTLRAADPEAEIPPPGPEPYVQLADLTPEGALLPGSWPYRVRGNRALAAALWDAYAGAFGGKDWDDAEPGAPYRRVVLIWRDRRLVLKAGHPLAKRAGREPPPLAARRDAFDALVSAIERDRTRADRRARRALGIQEPPKGASAPKAGGLGARGDSVPDGAAEPPPRPESAGPAAATPAREPARRQGVGGWAWGVLLALPLLAAAGAAWRRRSRAESETRPAAPPAAPRPPPVPAAPGRVKFLLWLALPAWELYCLSRIWVPDAWVSLRWSGAALALGPAVLALLAAEGLRRLGGRKAGWLGKGALLAGVLAMPFVALPALTGWGRPRILPNVRGFSNFPRLPEGMPPLRSAFSEIRLILHRWMSILQGTNRVLYVVGIPRRAWFESFERNAAKGPFRGYSPCDVGVPGHWASVDCPVPGPERRCYYCKSGNWNHWTEHQLAFLDGGRRAVLYVGVGPVFRRAIQDPGMLRLASSDAAMRYEPARGDPAGRRE